MLNKAARMMIKHVYKVFFLIKIIESLLITILTHCLTFLCCLSFKINFVQERQNINKHKINFIFGDQFFITFNYFADRV